MNHRWRLPLYLPCLLLTACAITSPFDRMPERIVFERGGMIPEGLEFDTNSGRFLVGSLVDGSIRAVASDGQLTAVVEDPELVSSVGIEVDEPRDRLLVANSDRAVFGGEVSGIAKLGVYRLSTGERIAMVDLGAVAGGSDQDMLFANDVTVGPDGTIYLTDTRRNLIYRVGQDYQASVFYRFEPLTGLQLNGIVYHPDGYLLVVAVSGQGLLFKVPVDEPQAAQPIDLSEPATGADGLVLTVDGRLIVVSNSTSSAYAYVSEDGWETASLDATASFTGQATTGAIVADDIYVVQPHFNDDEAPVILRVDL